MKIGVLGCGRWATFLSYYLHRIGHSVAVYGRQGSPHLTALQATRTNGLVTLPEGIALTDDLAQAIDGAEILVISVSAQGLRDLCGALAKLSLQRRTVVLCMKGLEQGTNLRLTQVAKSILDESNALAVWLGPGHVQEFLEGTPNCMVLDSEQPHIKRALKEVFNSDLIRFYYGTDLLGNEIGAASKNVIGIAAGMLDGFGLTALKGALTSRGAREIARLIGALGGDERSAYGLCHLGDYQATVFSPYSQNRRFGELYVRGEPYGLLAEGVHTIQPLLALGRQAGMEMPITQALYDCLFEKQDAKVVLQSLFLRSVKEEL